MGKSIMYLILGFLILSVLVFVFNIVLVAGIEDMQLTLHSALTQNGTAVVEAVDASNVEESKPFSFFNFFFDLAVRVSLIVAFGIGAMVGAIKGRYWFAC